MSNGGLIIVPLPVVEFSHFPLIPLADAGVITSDSAIPFDIFAFSTTITYFGNPAREGPALSAPREVRRVGEIRGIRLEGNVLRELP